MSSYVGSGSAMVNPVGILDISRFIGALVEAVNNGLITKNEARAWLESAAPSFAKALEPKGCSCPRCRPA